MTLRWPSGGQRSVIQAISPTAFLSLRAHETAHMPYEFIANEQNHRRINKSPLSLEDPEKGFLKKMLTTPPVKKIDLHFPLGLEVTARNLKGVTIKDALDAIYKQYRKKVCLCFSSSTILCTNPSALLVCLLA
jgi:hypothetical protein